MNLVMPGVALAEQLYVADARATAVTARNG